MGARGCPGSPDAALLPGRHAQKAVQHLLVGEARLAGVDDHQYLVLSSLKLKPNRTPRPQSPCSTRTTFSRAWIASHC